MAGELVGRVEFAVDLDGSTLPQQARAIGEKIAAAGSEAGDDYGKNFGEAVNRRLEAAGYKAAQNFGKGFSRGMRGSMADALGNIESTMRRDWESTFTRHGQRLAVSFGRSFQLGLRDFGEMGPSFEDMAGEMGQINAAAERLAITGRQNVVVWDGLLEDIGELRQVFDDIGGGGGIGNPFGGAAAGADDYSDSLRETDSWLSRLRFSHATLNKMLDDQGLKWSDLGHNARQWILIIGAVMAGMEELSVLGSAAGAGLVALGSGFSALITGGAGLIVVLGRLNQDLADAPIQMHGAILQFQGFKKAISDVNDAMSLAAFAEMGDAFLQLSYNVRGLTPALQKLGTVIGGLFRDLGENTKIGSDGFGVINEAIELGAQNFDALARTAGKFGLAMLRAFNEAQPLVEQMLGWVDKLVTRFDDFTQSPGFDVWIGNASRVFTAFGRLLDAIGRSLNDLVSPESVARTIAFLDNLTAFMPSLTTLLQILGELDVFGLLAQGLNDFGRELAPLAAPLSLLAESLNRIASIIINEFAQSLGTVATVIAPLVEDLAAFLDAIPEDVVRGIANGILVLAGAFVVLKGAQGVAAAGDAMSAFIGSATKANVISKSFASTLSKGLSRAGLWGAIAVGALAAAEGLNLLHREVTGIDDAALEAVAAGDSIADSYAKLGSSVAGTVSPLTDTKFALDNLTGSGATGMLGSLANAFKEGGGQANALSQTLGNLSPALAAMAEADLPKAVKQFSAYAEELGATDAQVMNMINTMPEFKAALEEAAAGADGLATDEEILNAALGRTPAKADEATGGIEDMAGAFTTSIRSIDELADAIRNFGNNTLTVKGATRDYQAAIDDLTQSVIDNGATLDINTEQGRANEAALDDIAGSALELAAATKEQTGSQEEANKVLLLGREELIKNLAQFGITGEAAELYADSVGLVTSAEGEATGAAQQHHRELVNSLEQMGLTGAEAEIYAGQLGDIPSDVPSLVKLLGVDPAIADAEDVRSALAKIKSREVMVSIVYQGYVRGEHLRPVNGQYPGASSGQLAAGGILTRATHVIAGEAGPEAYVPLNRPLSMVDPSVRWLSAIAQGMVPRMASGGIVGSGTSKTVNISPGAITIQGSLAPEATATHTVNRIAERIAG